MATLSTMLTSIVKTSALKTEGTSKTFGQLLQITTPASKPSVNTSVAASASPPTIASIFNASKAAAATQLVSLSTALQIKESTATGTAALTNFQNILKSALSPQATSNVNATSVPSLSLPQFMTIQSAILSPLQVQQSITEANKANLLITISSQFSTELEANTLQVPDIDLNLNYQFYDDQETVISTQEDLTQDPLLTAPINEVPRYIKLSWDPIEITEIIDSQDNLTTEEQQLVAAILKADRGMAAGSGMQNTFNASNKRLPAYKVNGRNVVLKDVQQLDQAMDFTANDELFRDTVSAALNISDSNGSQINLSDIILDD